MAQTREKLRKCTIYALDIYGRVFRKEGVRFAGGRIIPQYAEYTDVPEVAFFEARKRRRTYYMRTDPECRYLLVLAGEGHPEPAWHPAYDIRAFDALITEHIARTGVEVFFDHRTYVYDEALARQASHLNRLG
jgi:hypothetical protein